MYISQELKNKFLKLQPVSGQLQCKSYIKKIHFESYIIT